MGKPVGVSWREAESTTRMQKDSLRSRTLSNIEWQDRIVQQYRDCLSRQVGEAMHILFSKYKLLNSKNEYVQNCISRITVSEQVWKRKKRRRKKRMQRKSLKLTD